MLDFGFVPGLLEPGAERAAAPVLPHDRARQRFATRLVPGDHRLALVGDADRGDGRRILADRFACASQRLVPDLARIMFDPAGAWIMLRDFGLDDPLHRAVGCEDHRARGCGALVEDQNCLSHGGEPYPERTRKVEAAYPVLD